jgi:Ca2+-binding RTX toxin-like protein
LKEQKLQREKRRDERAKIAIFLSQGLALQQRCLSMQVDNSVFQDGNEWSKNTYHYLLTIDPSFSARFDASQGNNYSHGATVNGTYVPMPAGNDDEWNFLNKRMDTLKKLLEELKD